MLRYMKIAFICLFWLFVLAFLHYTLPQRDVVRIVETEIRRVDIDQTSWVSWFWAQADAGTATPQTGRDVRFINTVPYGGDIMVYRNEDTGWGWPPYFKLDSSNLQTEVADLVSSADTPQWVSITHYGWRNEIFSIFPNAVGVKVIDDPEQLMIPWFNIILLFIVAGLSLGVYRVIQYFKQEKIDPIFESIGDKFGRD